MFWVFSVYAAEKGELFPVHNGQLVAGNIMLEYTEGRVFRYKEWLVDRMLIQLTNAREPQGENRSFYNAWVQNKATWEFIDLGPMEKTRDNAFEGELRRGTDDITGFNYLIITLEANDGDASKGVHVYEWDILDTTLEYITELQENEQAERQPIIDLVKKRLGNIPNKTKLSIQKKLLPIRQKVINSARDNDYKIQVLYFLDIIRDAVRF